jgi:hypothetical protein
MAVFWVVAPCILVSVYQRFRSPYCLHYRPETLVNSKQSTRCYNSEDSHLRFIFFSRTQLGDASYDEPYTDCPSILVVLPFILDSRSLRILVTSELQYNLEVTGWQVIEILHPWKGSTVIAPNECASLNKILVWVDSQSTFRANGARGLLARMLWVLIPLWDANNNINYCICCAELGRYKATFRYKQLHRCLIMLVTCCVSHAFEISVVLTSGNAMILLQFCNSRRFITQQLN